MSEKDKEPTILKREETFISRNSFVPSILSEEAYSLKKSENQRDGTIALTDENAADYAGTKSFVGWKGRVDYALKHLEKDDSCIDAGLLSHLLENVISTVILSAGGGTPPDDYFFTTMLYLRCIRNEFGQHPPNIAALLEHLKAKAPQSVLLAMESVEDTNGRPPKPNNESTRFPERKAL